MTRVAARSVTIHANALVVDAAGILIRGRAGAGKSRLMQAVLDASGGRGRVVSDDTVMLRLQAHRLVAGPHPLTAGRMCLRGEDIRWVEHAAEAIVALVVDLVSDTAAPRPPYASFGDVRLPRLVLPASAAPAENARAVLAVLATPRAASAISLANFTAMHKIARLDDPTVLKSPPKG